MTNESPLNNFTGTLALVGAGKMGSAMLEGWLGLGLPISNIAVFEPQPSREITALTSRGLRLNPDPAGLQPNAVVIAIKPQAADEVLPKIKSLIRRETVVLSIMAGKTTKFLENMLPERTAIIRAMPNTPAAIRRGITVAFANPHVKKDQRELSNALMTSIGAVEWVDDESLMDAVTAVSGSGPAYVFLLAESLAHAGVAAGLPVELAAHLAAATVAGSGELLHRSHLNPAELRKNVTSTGGTTAAALDVLMGKDGLDAIIERAVAAATRRSRELAN